MTWKHDIDKHAPAFTEADEWEATSQGYESALEKWSEDMDWKSLTHQHDSRVTRWKAQAQSDLHSVGCPYDRLGAISEAAARLPGLPEYVEPEPRATKNPVTRAAQVHGLTRYAERLMQTAERKGIPWRSALNGDRSASSPVANVKGEWENVRERLSVLGEDLDVLAEGIVSGDITVTEEFQAGIQPDDPELRRVYQAQDKDREEARKPQQQDDQGQSAVAHEWLPERNENREVEHEPIGHIGPNGRSESWRSEQDTWEDSDVYNEWSGEDE